jgi:hypothetical protein
MTTDIDSPSDAAACSTFWPSATDIVAIVSQLNGEIFEKLGEEFDAFDAKFNGTSSVVDFLGNRVWFSEEDERTYDEASDSYEPLIDFLRRSAAEESAKIAEIAALWSNASVEARQ